MRLTILSYFVNLEILCLEKISLIFLMNSGGYVIMFLITNYSYLNFLLFIMLGPVIINMKWERSSVIFE